MENNHKTKKPQPEQAKGLDDIVKIQKILHVIIGNAQKSKDLPKNITEQLSFTCIHFLKICEAENIFFSGLYFFYKDKWIKIPAQDIINLLTDLALALGIDENKLLRKATTTNLYKEFLHLSKQKASKTFKIEELPKEDEKKNAPPLVMADLYVKKKYPKTSFNIISEQIDFGKKNKTFDDVITELRMINIKVSHSEFDTYLKSDKVKKDDPFNIYFSQLPKWDGKTDHIKKLASYIKTENQDFWESMFKKHLVRSVGQALGDGKFVNRFVIVLVSPIESIGKTTFIRFLNPLDGSYYIEQVDGDLALALTKHLILNMEEIESMTKNAFSKLKAFISSSAANMRTLFTQNFKNRNRRCSFWASTNSTEFLGGGENTRWLIINVKNIDFDYSGKVNINKVWAQAKALYDSKFDSNLTKEEKKTAKGISKDHKFKSHEAEYIDQYLNPSETKIATATEVARYLQPYAKAAFNVQRIGTALTGMEFKNKLLNGTKRYYIETKNRAAIHTAIMNNEKNGLP